MVDIQFVTAEIRRGKKKENRRWKSQGKDIMVCPITWGDNNEPLDLLPFWLAAEQKGLG